MRGRERKGGGRESEFGFLLKEVFVRFKQHLFRPSSMKAQWRQVKSLLCQVKMVAIFSAAVTLRIKLCPSNTVPFNQARAVGHRANVVMTRIDFTSKDSLFYKSRMSGGEIHSSTRFTHIRIQQQLLN